MTFLNLERINQIDHVAFQSQKPYPWINSENLLTEEGYQRLLDTLPDLSLFEQLFGKSRKYGQQSHDRYSLEYHDDLAVPQPWTQFVGELRGEAYRAFLSKMLGTKSFELSFHWHYTPNGCSVSPHCDVQRKLGSHIFYFNTEKDWDPAWGGETVILDDGGRFGHQSAPKFEDFDRAMGSVTLGNRSLLFARKERSWHGVREIRCPEGALRKVFIVVINRWSWVHALGSRLFGYHAGGY